MTRRIPQVIIHLFSCFDCHALRARNDTSQRGCNPLRSEFTRPLLGTSHTKEQVPKCVAAPQNTRKSPCIARTFVSGDSKGK